MAAILYLLHLLHVLLDHLLHLLVFWTADLVDLLSALEQNKSGDHLDSVFKRHVLGLFNVHLVEGDFAIIFIVELIDLGLDGLAIGTPGRVALDEDEAVVFLLADRIEEGLSAMYGVSFCARNLPLVSVTAGDGADTF